MGNRSAQLTARHVHQRIVYKTFAPNLDLAPVTGELLILKNAQAVIQSIFNLIMTYPTERYYQPNLGSTVSRGVFEFVDGFSNDQIKDSILRTLNTYEPRAVNPQVTVTSNPTQYQVIVNVTFGIALFPNDRFTVPAIVLPIRG